MEKKMCPVHKVPMERVGSGNYVIWVCPECQKIHDSQMAQREEEEKKREEEKRLNLIAKRITDAGIPRRFIDKTFEQYAVQSESQGKVLDGVKGFVTDRDNSLGLILIGNPGTGKNHLACACLKQFIRVRETSGQFTEVIKIVRKIKDTYNTKASEEDVMQTFVKIGLLVIDEIGIQIGSETECRYMSEIINDRYNAMLPTILIGNVTINEIEKLLGERTIDRFREGGKVFVFDWESWRRRSMQGK